MVSTRRRPLSQIFRAEKSPKELDILTSNRAMLQRDERLESLRLINLHDTRRPSFTAIEMLISCKNKASTY